VNNSDFWINVMRGIESVLEDKGFDIVLGIMNSDDMRNVRFPAAYTDGKVEGVIVVEVPSISVCNKLIESDMPTVFVDPPYGDLVGRTDIVLMENKQNIRKIMKILANMGNNDFAFAGEACTENVGMGFRERYEAVVSTAQEFGLMFDPERSFLMETSNDFIDTQNIVSKLKAMKKIPSVFICGNDLTAIRLMKAIKSLHLKVPEDVKLVGFDNVQDSITCNPPLTTINSPKEYLGEMAAKKLIARIERKTIPFEFSQYSTNLILRQSTGHTPQDEM
jgi:LacI family transcriptional regulator